MSKALIYKRPGSPFFYITGLRKSTGTDKRPLALEIAAAELEKHLKLRKLGENSIRCWHDLVEAWGHEKGYQKRTYDIDLRIIRALTFAITRSRLSLLQSIVDSDVLNQYFSSVKERASASTANRHMNTVKAMFNFAWKRKWINHPPQFTRYKVEEPTLVGALSQEDIEAIIAHLDPKYEVIVRIAALTGLRRANVVGLKWEWINEERTVITVPAQFTKAQTTYVGLINEEAKVLLGPHGNNGPVFAFGAAPNAVSVAFRRAAKAAGIKAHFHQLRHTWASRHVENGTPDRILMAIGGWQSPAMLSRYAHLRQSHLLEYAENSKEKDLPK